MLHAKGASVKRPQLHRKHWMNSLPVASTQGTCLMQTPSRWSLALFREQQMEVLLF